MLQGVPSDGLPRSEWETAKLRFRVSLTCDENLRAVQWSVSTRDDLGQELQTFVVPSTNLPWTEAVDEVLVELLLQHTRHVPSGPFDGDSAG